MPFYDPTKRTYLEVLNTSTEYGIIPFANCVVFATAVPEIKALAVRSMTVKTTASSEITTGILVNPVGANSTLTVEASDATHTTDASATSGTITFKADGTEIGKINVTVA